MSTIYQDLLRILLPLGKKRYDFSTNVAIYFGIGLHCYTYSDKLFLSIILSLNKKIYVCNIIPIM